MKDVNSSTEAMLLKNYHRMSKLQPQENIEIHRQICMQSEKNTKNPENIVRKWCELLGVTPHFIKQNTRIIKGYKEYKSPISIRHMICWYFVERQDYIPYNSLQQISELVGGKEHSRVLHGHKTAENLAFSDSGFKMLLTETSKEVDNFFAIDISK